MRTIEIDLTEDDCELFRREVIYKNNIVEWVFADNEQNEEFIIKFIPYEEPQTTDDI